jgi:phosphonate transport system permease protein
MVVLQTVIDAHRRERLIGNAAVAACAVIFVLCCYLIGFDPVAIVAAAGKLAGFVSAAFPPSTGGMFIETAQALAETVAIAFAGSVLASIVAIPFSFAGASNVVSTKPLHFVIRRALDFVRGIDVLVWALVFVSAVGLGPFAGILAISVVDAAVLSKVFAEAIEAIDSHQVEGVTASGADRLTVLRFSFVPQVAPIFLSNILYTFESNVRSATVLGIVGAGGIGYQLAERMKLLQWNVVAMMILMTFVVVVCIDFVSGKIRHRLS